MSDAPGGETAKRLLFLFLLLDISSSMIGDKIQALNFAMREVIAALVAEAKKYPTTQLFVQLLTFASTVTKLQEEPVPVEKAVWTDAVASGSTELGAALAEVTSVLQSTGDKKVRPDCIVLMSDGQPTDYVEPSYQKALRDLLSTGRGEKANRMSVAFGSAANVDLLKGFASDPNTGFFVAKDAASLASALKWASITGVERSSNPATPPTYSPQGGVVSAPHSNPMAGSSQPGNDW